MNCYSRRKCTRILLGTMLVGAFALPYSSSSVAATTSGQCGVSKSIQDARVAYHNRTREIVKPNERNSTSLGAASCIKQLMNIGTSIGTSSINISSLLDSLERRACNAAKQKKNEILNGINQKLPNGRNHVRVNSSGGTHVYNNSSIDATAGDIWKSLN